MQETEDEDDSPEVRSQAVQVEAPDPEALPQVPQSDRDQQQPSSDQHREENLAPDQHDHHHIGMASQQPTLLQFSLISQHVREQCSMRPMGVL